MMVVPTPAITDLPLAGGCGRLNIADNNMALTDDRVYFLYNHFHNALVADANLLGGGDFRRISVDRYTVGGEKTFVNGDWSVELPCHFAAKSTTTRRTSRCRMEGSAT